MKRQSAEVVVAGHICLDIIPAIHGKDIRIDEFLIPGKLVEIGTALIATGGAVSNTGLALHRLGLQVNLMGKVGDDLFGQAILEKLRGYGEHLTEGMIVSPNEQSSYTIVISPPGVDRIFLHCTGANDTFQAADVNVESLDGSRLFHFGYPPLMRNMYEHQGDDLVRLLSSVKAKGLTVSLDLAKPDPSQAAGRADWRTILRKSLPFVDVFLPSFEEILYMLQPDNYRQMRLEHGTEELLPYADGTLLSKLADELLDMGAAVVALKLGEFGLYVKTSSDPGRILAMGACSPGEEGVGNWLGKELLAPCFRVDAVGTTGAGDCTIAGFLAGLLKGLTVEEILISAVGVGACNVEKADAVSGVPVWRDVQERIKLGWPQRTEMIPLPGWNWNKSFCLWEYQETMERG